MYLFDIFIDIYLKQSFIRIKKGLFREWDRIEKLVDIYHKHQKVSTFVIDKNIVKIDNESF